MTENDVLAVLIAATAIVRVTSLVLAHRRSQAAADRKAAKEVSRGNDH